MLECSDHHANLLFDVICVPGAGEGPGVSSIHWLLWLTESSLGPTDHQRPMSKQRINAMLESKQVYGTIAQ